MRSFSPSAPSRKALNSGSSVRRLWANEDGATAIEFAMVGLPFIFFVVAIIGYGLYFLTSTYLQYGVEAAARQIRTGQANSGGQNGEGMTVGDFRKLVCNNAKAVIDCGKMTVMVQHGSDWTGITPQSCTNARGGQSSSTGDANDALSQYAGAASEVVLVTACYRWDLASSLSFLKLGSGSDGSGPAIIQAATAFKSEPYSN